jgi:hypothetical protein
MQLLGSEFQPELTELITLIVSVNNAIDFASATEFSISTTVLVLVNFVCQMYGDQCVFQANSRELL